MSLLSIGIAIISAIVFWFFALTIEPSGKVHRFVKKYLLFVFIFCVIGIIFNILGIKNIISEVALCWIGGFCGFMLGIILMGVIFGCLKDKEEPRWIGILCISLLIILNFVGTITIPWIIC